MRNRHHRHLLAAVLGLLALVIAAPPVMADERVDKGKTGEYTVYDESGNADVICRYLAGGAFDRIAVRNPFVHSSNYLANPTRKQWVGWRVIIERRKPGSLTWSRYLRSSFIKRTATQETIANFPDRVFDLPSTNHQWRVRTVIRWYRPGTTSDTIGTVQYAYDWYKRRQAQNPADDFAPDYCIPQY